MDLAHTDIDWEKLQGSFRNVWSATALQSKWARLKLSVDQFEKKTHRGVFRLHIHSLLDCLMAARTQRLSQSFMRNTLPQLDVRARANNTR